MKETEYLKEKNELVDIVHCAFNDWDNYSDDCYFEHISPIESVEDFVADAVLRAGYRKQEWVSVEERLPENDYEKHWKERQRFLVYTEPNGLMYVAKYGYKEYGWWSDGGGYVLDERSYRKVTHWMPLPQPPKGE